MTFLYFSYHFVFFSYLLIFFLFSCGITQKTCLSKKREAGNRNLNASIWEMRFYWQLTTNWLVLGYRYRHRRRNTPKFPDTYLH